MMADNCSVEGSMFRKISPRQEQTDERLMSELTAGRQEALGPLYSRYARVVFAVASHSLDRAAAEEVVQDVFLTVWRKASVFDPRRGAFRPWLLQIAHYRVLNELRGRSRRPQAVNDPDGFTLASVPDSGLEPDEIAWRDSVRSTVRSAFDELPAAQREALKLAFFEDQTHEQVAEELRLPLGTAKTRIRGGLQRLRDKLAPLAIGGALVAILGAAGVLYHDEVATRNLDERALTLATTSETKVIRLAPTPNAPRAAHGYYRGRAGVPMAILTVSYLSPAPQGRSYQAWVRHGAVWTSLGVVRIDAQGEGRVIAEGSAFETLPNAIEVTIEPAGGSVVPTGVPVVNWP